DQTALARGRDLAAGFDLSAALRPKRLLLRQGTPEPRRYACPQDSPAALRGTTAQRIQSRHSAWLFLSREVLGGQISTLHPLHDDRAQIQPKGPDSDVQNHNRRNRPVHQDATDSADKLRNHDGRNSPWLTREAQHDQVK